MRAVLYLAAILVNVPALAVEVIGPAAQEILDVDTQRTDAMTRSDVAALDKLLAAELSYITTTARVEDKQSLLYAIRTRQTTFDRIVPAERHARVTGDLALVTGVAAMKGVDRKHGFDMSTRYTAVYVRRDSRWQLIAFQATQLLPGDRVIGGESA